MARQKQHCLAALFIMLAAVSCSVEEIPEEELFVTTDRPAMRADGFDEIKITVSNQDGKDCTANCRLYINDMAVSGDVFLTEDPGTYLIRAKKGTTLSDTATVEATDPGPSSFTRKILCEDYTGAWCGHCPRVGIQLENYVDKNAGCIVVGIHNGDSYSYIYESQMRSRFRVQGFPTVVVNRSYTWNENESQLNRELGKRAILGLALETTIAGTTINIRTKIKSDVTTTIPMKLVVMLVEDNLLSTQRNYGYWGLPDPISNYNNVNVLRKAATDIFGDAIPTDAIVEDTEWMRDFTFNASDYNISNCRVIAFVIYSSDEAYRMGVLNVQEVAAGQNQDYD